jgi:hypothetical protein
MAEFIDPPNPFSSTKAWRDFLARSEQAEPKSPAVLNAIGTARTELKRRARYKGRPYWEPDEPEEPAKG